MAVDVLVRGQQRPQQLRTQLSRDVEGGRELADEVVDDTVEAVRLEVQKQNTYSRMNPTFISGSTSATMAV